MDATYVYWADDSFPQATIRRVLKTGGMAETATDNPNAGEPVVDIAVDQNGVYWTSSTVLADGSMHSFIYAWRFGGTNVVLAEGQFFRGLVLDGSTLYYSDESGVWFVPTGGGPAKQLAALQVGGRLAVDPWHVFLGAESGRILRLEKNTGAITVIGEGVLGGSPLPIAVDINRAYVVDYRGTLFAFPPQFGTTLGPVGSGSGATAGGFVVRDGTKLYYESGQGLARIDTDGSGFAVLAPNVARGVVDGDSVYFTQGAEVDVVCK